MIPVYALSALTVAGNLSGMMDAYLTAIAERHWKERDAKVAALRTTADVQARQSYIREKITASLGGWPEKTPLKARATGVLERDGYRIEKLIYESLPGFKVTANLYVPTKSSGPYPAILGTAGHSVEGKAADLYQRAWIGMVRRGWMVLAYDPMGQGDRSEYADLRVGTRQHTAAGIQAILTGTNIARYEIWDGIRGVDYLLSRKDVDPAKIAVAGNSGGGTQSAYLMALEPRLAAAAPSCYITSWEKLWLGPGPQDAEQNFHGFVSDGLNFADFLIAFGPKPVKMMTAIKDFFPIEGARATFREAASVFEKMGAREKVDFFEYDDGHGWSKPRRESTYRWFSKWLSGKEEDGAEQESTVEKVADLTVPVEGGSETVASLNRKLADELHARRAGGDVAARIAFAMPPGKTVVRGMGEVGRDGYRIERIALETEPGITVPGLLYAASGSTTAEIWLNPLGKAVDDREIAGRVTRNHAVFAIDPRGWGESKPKGEYQTWMRGYLLGRTLVGMQVVDVLRAAEYLRSRGFEEVNVYGKGNAGALAIYAGVIGGEGKIKSVRTDGKAPSYMDIVRMHEPKGVLDMIVPGVLKDFDLPDLKKRLGARYAK